VLVVDDEPLVRDALARMLPASHYDVATASRAEEVAADVDIDVLVTDVVLPGAGGPALADRLQAARPTLAVVLVSGFAPELHADPRVSDGVWVVLEKPFRARGFLEAAERAMRATR
jgi:FixJ family two-component response regulator